MQSSWGLPCVGLKLSSNPSPIMLFNFYYLEILIARGRPTHISHAVQTPRGHFLFIADHLEDPAVTEDFFILFIDLKKRTLPTTGTGSNNLVQNFPVLNYRSLQKDRALNCRL